MIAATLIAATLAGCGRNGAVPAGGSGRGEAPRGGGAVDCAMPAPAAPWVVIVGDVITASVLGAAISRNQVLCDDGAFVLPPPPRCPNIVPGGSTIVGGVAIDLDEARLRCGRDTSPRLRSALR
jgi:hypothetical protein